MGKCIFIGFDFSMNKPAATILYNKEFSFYIWPADLSKANVQKYVDAGVSVRERGLDSVSAKTMPNSLIVLEHTKRSTDLANMIIADLDEFMDEADGEITDIFVSSEGLSYGSKGDAALNLATYKGVLLSKIFEHYGQRLKGLYTYPPITMKSVAGCAKKGELSDKNKMITAFVKDPTKSEFKTALAHGRLTAKTNFIPCVDDIVDSYWAVKTMLVKEKFIK